MKINKELLCPRVTSVEGTVKIKTSFVRSESPAQCSLAETCPDNIYKAFVFIIQAAGVALNRERTFRKFRK